MLLLTAFPGSLLANYFSFPQYTGSRSNTWTKFKYMCDTGNLGEIGKLQALPVMDRILCSS